MTETNNQQENNQELFAQESTNKTSDIQEADSQGINFVILEAVFDDENMAFDDRVVEQSQEENFKDDTLEPLLVEISPDPLIKSPSESSIESLMKSSFESSTESFFERPTKIPSEVLFEKSKAKEMQTEESETESDCSDKTTDKKYQELDTKFEFLKNYLRDYIGHLDDRFQKLDDKFSNQLEYLQATILQEIATSSGYKNQINFGRDQNVTTSQGLSQNQNLGQSYTQGTKSLKSINFTIVSIVLIMLCLIFTSLSFFLPNTAKNQIGQMFSPSSVKGAEQGSYTKDVLGARIMNEFAGNSALLEIGTHIQVNKKSIESKGDTNCQTPVAPPAVNGCGFVIALSKMGLSDVKLDRVEIVGSISQNDIIEVDLKNYNQSISGEIIDKKIGSITKDQPIISLPAKIEANNGLYFRIWEGGVNHKSDTIPEKEINNEGFDNSGIDSQNDKKSKTIISAINVYYFDTKELRKVSGKIQAQDIFRDINIAQNIQSGNTKEDQNSLSGLQDSEKFNNLSSTSSEKSVFNKNFENNQELMDELTVLLLKQAEKFEIHRDLNKNQKLDENEPIWQCQDDFPGTKLVFKNLEESLKNATADQIAGKTSIILDYELQIDDTCIKNNTQKNIQKSIPDGYWILLKKGQGQDLTYSISVKGDVIFDLSK